jgi:hypothetical protein
MKAEKRTNQLPPKLTPALSDSNCSDVVDNDFGFRFALLYAINQHHTNPAVHCILDARLMMDVQFAIQSLTRDQKRCRTPSDGQVNARRRGQDAASRRVPKEMPGSEK